MIEEPHGKFEFEGTITFPKEKMPEVAEEVPPKPFPWAWLVVAGSLFVSAIICLSIE